MHAFAVLCSGQGDQSATMFDVVASEADGAAVITAFSATAGVDLVARARANDRLFENAYAQQAVVAQAVAAWTCLSPQLPRPALFAGYSAGEVSAWACARRWDAALASGVVRQRAEAMDRLGPPGCGMVAVRGLPREEVERLAVGLYIAIVNERDHLIMAGPDRAIDLLLETIERTGAWAQRLDVHVPSHTPLMQTAAHAFAGALQVLPIDEPHASCDPQALHAPVLRGIDGAACRRADDVVAALSRAIAETICWDACMQTLSESGVRVVLELGPGHALARLCAARCPEVRVRSLSDFRSMAGVVAWMLRSLAD